MCFDDGQALFYRKWNGVIESSQINPIQKWKWNQMQNLIRTFNNDKLNLQLSFFFLSLSRSGP